MKVHYPPINRRLQRADIRRIPGAAETEFQKQQRADLIHTVVIVIACLVSSAISLAVGCLAWQLGVSILHHGGH